MHIWSSVIAQIRKGKGKWDLIAEEKILLGVDLAVWWSPFLLPNLWCFVWDSFPYVTVMGALVVVVVMMIKRVMLVKVAVVVIEAAYSSST